MESSRNSFNNTWLGEMPSGIGTFGTFDQIEYNINDLKKQQVNIIELSNNLKKVELSQTAYYWYEKDNIILLGVELEKKAQGLTIRLTGKNPKIQGKAPFASDLYNAVLDDSNRSIRLLSDTQLSDEGYNIWTRLFKQGNKVSIYDRTLPGQTFKTFDTVEEFNYYFTHDDTNYEKYQYVLSESREMVAEMRGFFHIRRFRELTGLSLTD